MYFSYKSVQDLKSDLREDGKHIQNQLSNEVSQLGVTLKQDLKNDIERARETVTSRIDEEFKQENISQLVQSKAKERIDTIADQLIANQVATRITPLKEEFIIMVTNSSNNLNEKLDKISKAEKESRSLLNEASSTLTDIKKQSEFVLTVLEAQSDNRAAYSKICMWASDQSYLLNRQASRAQFSIERNYAGIEPNHKLLSWKKEFDQTKMSFKDIMNDWQHLPSDLARAYVEFVWDHKNITKEEKLTFLHNVLSDSRNSLHAVDKAARLLSDEAKIAYNPPLDFSKIEKWWQNRDNTSNTKDTTNNAIDSDKK